MLAEIEVRNRETRFLLGLIAMKHDTEEDAEKLSICDAFVFFFKTK